MATCWWCKIQPAHCGIPHGAQGGQPHAPDGWKFGSGSDMGSLCGCRQLTQLTSMPQEPRGAQHRLKKTLPATADIWERSFPSMAKHWTCSTREKKKKKLSKIYIVYFKRQLEFGADLAVNFSHIQCNQLVFQFSCFIIQWGVWGKGTGL